MAVLHNLKKVHRFDCSTIFCPFGSRSRRFVVGDPTPTYFSIQNRKFFCTHVITSQDEKFTQNYLRKSCGNFTQNYLRKSCGLSLEGAISASKRVKLQCPERADSVLAILRNHGFSETQVAQVVRSHPRILLSNFEKTVLPKLHYFTSVGVSADDLAKAVASNPMLLGQSLENHIIPTHKLLRSMLPHKSVGAVLKSGSRIYMANHGTSVLPNISLLRQVGMPQSGISFLLVHLSRLVSLKHESFAQLVAEAKEMGFNMKNSTSLHAMKALWCKNALNRSRGVCMMSWGWSEDDFISAFRKRPKSMLVSEKKIMQVMEFLVNKMGWPSVLVAKYPIIFCCSLEKRIIPRFSVFKVLLLKGLVQKDLSLLYVLQIGEEKFLKRFVTKFVNQIPQLLSVYQGNVDIHDVIDTLQTESL